MKSILLPALLLLGLSSVAHLDAACCFFSAKDRDVLQPAQKTFISWDPAREQVTFTVQPKFEGNALDFGMVIPTPSQPQLNEMPKDFFMLLGTFSIMEPVDREKFPMKNRRRFLRSSSLAVDAAAFAEPKAKSTVKIIEAGVVGTLDYKIITAERSDDLYTWLKEHEYAYSGDEETLGHYVNKKWFFTVMKIDPKQIAGGAERTDRPYAGEITPTRFTFSSDKLVYPLRITRVSVKDRTEALFYIQAPSKMDLPPSLSYQDRWQPQWSGAMDMAVPELMTAREKEWKSFMTPPKIRAITKRLFELKREGYNPATLEWAKRMTAKDIGYLAGTEKFNRTAPDEEIAKLRQLRGHIQQGQFITKVRKVFKKDEMSDDLVFVPARVDGREDAIEYYQALPMDPP